MSAQNAGVPLYRPYIPGTAVHSKESGTVSGTEAGTLSLKALSTLYLMEQKSVQPMVQGPVHKQKKCTTGESGSGTLFEGKNAPVQAMETASKIDYQIENAPSFVNEPTLAPAALAHARSLLVACPVQRRGLHCWYCSRCSEVARCTAWRSRRHDVEFFRNSEKPYSLYLVEEAEGAEVLQ